MDETNEQVVEGEENAEETIDWQARAKELEAKAIKQRETTKALKAKLSELEAQAPKEEIKPADLNDGQKALLRSLDVRGQDETALYKEFAKKRPNETMEEIVESLDFKAKLDALRTTKANQAASDVGGSGGASIPKNSAEYYLSKGEEPPRDAPREVRQKYVSLRRDAETNKKMFYND